MSIDQQTGAIQWLPDSTGAFFVAIWVTDPRGAKATQNYTLTVLAPNNPPIITSTPITVAIENILYNYQLSAEDADADQLRYSLSIAPAGMSIGPDNGLIQWTPNSGGQYDVTVLVEDSQVLRFTIF